MDDEIGWELIFIYVVGLFMTFGGIVNTWSLFLAIFFSIFWPFYWLAMFGHVLAGS